MDDKQIRKVLLEELAAVSEKWPEHILKQIADGVHGAAWTAVVNAMHRMYEQGLQDEAERKRDSIGGGK